jgi:hypothetical protein
MTNSIVSSGSNFSPDNFSVSLISLQLNIDFIAERPLSSTASVPHELKFESVCGSLLNYFYIII